MTAERDGDRPESARESPTLSVVIVTYEAASLLGRTLPAITAALRPSDELIVCDNRSSDGTPELVGELAPEAILIETGANLGFGAAANRGAERAGGDLLLFLNPDNLVGPGFRDAIELPATEGRGWAAWQGLVTDDDGALLNSIGGAVHFTGIAWAAAAGRPRSEAPSGPAEVAFASGACLAVERGAWERLGGFSDPYFLYQEDTDLGLRLWLAGERVGIEPRALCDHAYEFDKGAQKWRYLERNRWATIIRTYPRRLLLALLPGLIATELALLPAAALGGWLPQKLWANLEVLGALPRLLRERREIQAGARIGATGFAARLGPDLDSTYLGRAGSSRPLRTLLRGYWSLVLRLL